MHGPVAVVHFDAHLDTWDTYFGAAVHPRHPVPPGRPRRASLDTDRLPARRHPRPAVRQRRTSRTTDARLPASSPPPTSTTTASTRSSSSCADRVGDRPVYVSIDIDVLDPAHAPGTGTPEAGGMTSRELLEILRGFGRPATWSAPTSSRSRPPTTTPRSPASPPRTSPTSCCPPSPPGDRPARHDRRHDVDREAEVPPESRVLFSRERHLAINLALAFSYATNYALPRKSLSYGPPGLPLPMYTVMPIARPLLLVYAYLYVTLGGGG